MKKSPVDPSVFFAEGDLVRVGRPDIELLKKELAASGRLRVRLCAHPSLDAKIHEMFIILKKEGYVRPHKHAVKTESLEILEGRADAVVFDDAGGVAEVIKMGDYASGLQFYYRLDRPRYHTLLLKTDTLVFKETANGPFDRAETSFPDWAPADADSAAGRAYLKDLEKRLE